MEFSAWEWRSPLGQRDRTACSPTHPARGLSTSGEWTPGAKGLTLKLGRFPAGPVVFIAAAITSRDVGAGDRSGSSGSSRVDLLRNLPWCKLAESDQIHLRVGPDCCQFNVFGPGARPDGAFPI